MTEIRYLRTWMMYLNPIKPNVTYLNSINHKPAGKLAKPPKSHVLTTNQNVLHSPSQTPTPRDFFFLFFFHHPYLQRPLQTLQITFQNPSETLPLYIHHRPNHSKHRNTQPRHHTSQSWRVFRTHQSSSPPIAPHSPARQGVSLAGESGDLRSGVETRVVWFGSRVGGFGEGVEERELGGGGRGVCGGDGEGGGYGGCEGLEGDGEGEGEG